MFQNFVKKSDNKGIHAILSKMWGDKHIPTKQLVVKIVPRKVISNAIFFYHACQFGNREGFQPRHNLFTLGMLQIPANYECETWHLI